MYVHLYEALELEYATRFWVDQEPTVKERDVCEYKVQRFDGTYDPTTKKSE